ncbi:MAG TPA: LUD domain-containing protein, partial [Burkholderiales bacterium]|nr:LUD domain-containing protein [Burkholderiales bacterium]HVC12779.1 LUD domain-containing protein [Burkholderiales bacterium]
STVSLLPETHVAVVPVARLVAHMEDAWELLRAELGQLPRAVNFISGPSRTGDIEQTIILGAHGPYRVHVVLVG